MIWKAEKTDYKFKVGFGQQPMDRFASTVTVNGLAKLQWGDRELDGEGAPTASDQTFQHNEGADIAS